MTIAPVGWTASTLGELGSYLNGRGFKKSEWAESGRPIIRIQNLTGSGEKFNYFAGEVEDRYVARPGDLLASWAATLGAFIWNGPEAVVNQHIFKVESRIDTKFHKYLLDFKLTELMRETHGSGMVHITRGRFDRVPVLIPPLCEQRRIVDILEDHLSRLDAASVLIGSALFRTRSLDMSMSDIAIWSANWARKSLSELLAEPLRNGHSARASTDGSGVRTLNLTAVTRGEFTDANTKMTVADPGRVRNLWLRPGDILVQRSNTPELVGTSAYYDGPSDWAIFPDLLIRARVDARLAIPRFVWAAIASERAHGWLRGQAKGLSGSMPKIDQGTIGALQVPVPPLSEQSAILARLVELRGRTGRLSAAASTARRRSVSLRRELVRAAFSGRLTGHPSDIEEIEELVG